MIDDHCTLLCINFGFLAASTAGRTVEAVIPHSSVKRTGLLAVPGLYMGTYKTATQHKGDCPL
ncbi:MAG: hypothetical protein N2316_02300 [Spirochaetes bacterium]|nr:hypothetical protein [Spirochaetota bacterium]